MRQALDEVRQRLERVKRDTGDVRIDLGLGLGFPRVHISSRNRRLGAELEDLSGQLAKYFGVEQGVLVRQVGEGSVGDESGLRAGDVIVRVDGEAVRTASHCERSLAQIEGVASVDVMRNRAQVTLQIDLESRSDSVADRPRPRVN